MIIDFIERYKKEGIHPEDVLVLALHDALEEHPEYWHDIITTFWLSVFRDVLVLSTWGIPYAYRGQILTYFNEHHEEWKHIKWTPKTEEEDDLLDIIHNISPMDPFDKLHNKSIYSDNPHSPEFQQIENAMNLYTEKIILGKNKVPRNFLLIDKEYLWLGNYCYFKKKDVRRKLRDMLHNMRDMEWMEKKKPWYIKTRRIKAYILWVKLKSYGMDSEFSELENAFQKTWYTMLTHNTVLQHLNYTSTLHALQTEIEEAGADKEKTQQSIEKLRKKVIVLWIDINLFEMNKEYKEEFTELEDSFTRTLGVPLFDAAYQYNQSNSESH